MAYKPSEARYKGGGKFWYIKYLHFEATRGKKKVWKPRVKRVFISGELKRTGLGAHTKKSGKKVYGILFTYKNKRKAFDAQRGVTKYHVKRTNYDVEKIVELPRGAKDISITDKKREVEPTLLGVK